jgi:hypothetical protein
MIRPTVLPHGSWCDKRRKSGGDDWKLCDKVLRLICPEERPQQSSGFHGRSHSFGYGQEDGSDEMGPQVIERIRAHE